MKVVYVAKPRSVSQKLDKSLNIFAQPQLPSFIKQSDLKSYSIVGDSQTKQQFYDRYVRKSEPQLTNYYSTESANRYNRSLQTVESINQDTPAVMNMTNVSQPFNRTFTSNKTQSCRQMDITQANTLSKQKRVIERFGKYEAGWSRFQQNISRKLKRQVRPAPSVRLRVQDNPTKYKVIQNNVKQFWQMSLRNNSKRLMRHLDGVPVDDLEKLKRLNTLKGSKSLQDSIKNNGDRISKLKCGFRLQGRKAETDQSLRQTSKLTEHSCAPSYSDFKVQEVLGYQWKHKSVSKYYQR